MSVTVVRTVVGYDSGSGEKLFEHQPSAFASLDALELRRNGISYEANGRRYAIVSHRNSSNPTLIELNVKEVK